MLTKGRADKADVGYAVVDAAVNATRGAVFQRWVSRVSLRQEVDKPIVARCKDDDIWLDGLLLLLDLLGLGSVVLFKMHGAIVVKVGGPRRHVDDFAARGLDVQIDQPGAPLVERGRAPPRRRDVRQRAVRLAKQQRVDMKPLGAHAADPLVKARAGSGDGPRHVFHERVVGDPQQRPTLEEAGHVRGVEQRRDGAVERLVGPGGVGPAGALAGAVRLGHDLGRVAEAVAVADEDALGGGGDGQVGHVHGGLAGAQDEDGGVLAELCAGLEGGGVQNGGFGGQFTTSHLVLVLMVAVAVGLGHFGGAGRVELEARNVWDEGHSVQTTADGHSVVVMGAMDPGVINGTIISTNLTVSLVGAMAVGVDNVTWLSGVWLNGLDGGGAVDVLPQIKLVGVGFQVVDIFLRCDEVGLLLRDPEVGERRQVLGGDKLESQN